MIGTCFKAPFLKLTDRLLDTRAASEKLRFSNVSAESIFVISTYITAPMLRLEFGLKPQTALLRLKWLGTWWTLCFEFRRVSKMGVVSLTFLSFWAIHGSWVDMASKTWLTFVLQLYSFTASISSPLYDNIDQFVTQCEISKKKN